MSKEPDVPQIDDPETMRALADTAYARLRKKLVDDDSTPQTLCLMDRAYAYALDAHGLQKRRSGEPYITHPVAVAEILLEFGLDPPTLVAAMLHDVAEDTQVTLPAITKAFGEEIAKLVDGVTKLTKLEITQGTVEEQQAENIRKMLISMSADIRVILIKLADRLHNLRTLEFMPTEKQLQKARETLDIFAPIAHRLGVRWVKEELEDLSLRYIDSPAFAEVRDFLEKHSAERTDFLRSTQQAILDCVRTLCPDAEVSGRIKSTYGIYRKMFLQHKDFDELFDVFAVRVIVNTKEECYNALGLIHAAFTPIAGRLKDYISMPKPNGYQSIHTVVLVRKHGEDGIPFEVQIRTREMHEMAEYGVAAHWKYKRQLVGASTALDKQLDWLRKLVDAQREVDESEDLVQTLKSDFVPEEIYISTPKGDIIALPQGATVIDFAYAIHSGVGERMIGAKINARITPLDTELKTGQIVSIMTSPPPGDGPSRDWLSIAKTSSARSKIRSWFKRKERPENVRRGREELEKELGRNKIFFADDDLQDVLQDAARRHHFEHIDDFYAAIGYGGLSVFRMLSYFNGEAKERARARDAALAGDTLQITAPAEIRRARSKEGVVVEGLDDVLLSFGRCCMPLPGDDIIGFITRGHGVRIHKQDCTNASDKLRAKEPGRWLTAYWDTAQSGRFEASLLVEYQNRIGMLADISTLCANMHVDIAHFGSRGVKDDQRSLVLGVMVSGPEQVSRLRTRILEIRNVTNVERFME
ncbi:MAG: bifunctional (p)ppGpp synthetase/guanosine-3',5'-bis(diphosphate) 3'-pyrophosphohydrolase [Oscillospiraceae bacterium]|jgi:GTP pyrophosphokinase|nr:bifunctional (p)ppGpp synthetase/guanosine-3',5'-bis(diphosphate) 3'-pyrophosphohydrolase [Oscillospiraceae bacterium]